MSENTVIRHFSMKQEGNKTLVHIAEMSNGYLWMRLTTPRDGVDWMVTEMMLKPATFTLP